MKFSTLCLVINVFLSRAMKKALLKAEKENKAKDGSNLLEVSSKKNEAVLQHLSLENEVKALKATVDDITQMMADRRERL